MSGHKVQCCLLQVCCSPRKQREALAHVIEEAGSPDAAAAAILEAVGLVPLGVDLMIRDTYGPMFKAMALEGTVPPNPSAAGTPDGKA
jgi:hypothetical protein